MAEGSSTEESVIKRVARTFTIPREGTFLRPLVRSFRENVLKIKFEGKQQLDTIKDTGTVQVDEIEAKTNAKIKEIETDVLPEELVTTKKTLAQKFKDVKIKPEITYGVSLLALSAVSYRFGPRILLRNLLVGGIGLQAYLYPETIQRAYKGIPTKVVLEKDD